jgi:hypothetical protein
MAFRLGTPGRGGAATGLTDLLNTGLIEIYTGPQPTNVSDVGTGDLLGTCTFGNSAFTITSGVATAEPITADSNADQNGIAGYFKLRDSGDEYTVADGTCGQGGGDLSFDNATIIAGGTIDVTGFIITVPV